MRIRGDGKIHIGVQYQVWCADCYNMIDYQEFRNQKEAEQSYRAAGVCMGRENK